MVKIFPYKEIYRNIIPVIAAWSIQRATTKKVRSGYGLILNLTNASDQPIIAYEAIIVQYDVYGNKLKGSSDTSFYKAIQCAPVDFEPDSSDFRRYSYYESTSYAEVYLYYVLFEDRTSWGYREYMNPVQAMKYGKKFVLERT